MRASSLLVRPIAFHRPLVTITGSVDAALFLSQALYWSRKSPDGWFYKIQEEWTEETGLSRFEQERSRKALRRLGLLDERRERIVHRLFYRVNLDALDAALDGLSEGVVLETRITECEKVTFGSAGNSLPSNIGTETTTESTSPGKKPGASDRGLAFADWFLKSFATPPRLTANWRERWAKCFDDMIRLDGRTEKQIADVCRWAREDSFWTANFLSPCKLREKKHGISYFDSLTEKMNAAKAGRRRDSKPPEPVNHRDYSETTL